MNALRAKMGNISGKFQRFKKSSQDYDREENARTIYTYRYMTCAWGFLIYLPCCPSFKLKGNGFIFKYAKYQWFILSSLKYKI